MIDYGNGSLTKMKNKNLPTKQGKTQTTASYHVTKCRHELMWSQHNITNQKVVRSFV